MKIKNQVSQMLGYSLLVIFSPIILPFALFFTLFSLLLKTGERKVHLKTLYSELLALFILGLVYLFIISPQEIGGNAMEPTIRNGEYLVLFKVYYHVKEPQRGDIVVFMSPKNKDIDYISRIVAIAGDTIQIQEGEVFLNGSMQKEPYIMGVTMASNEDGAVKEGVALTVPTDHFFVLSDNRQHASDSRNFGPVPKSNLIGKSILRFWPFERFGLLDQSRLSTQSQSLTGDDLYKTGRYFLKLKNSTKAEEYFTKAGTEYKYAPALIELGNMYFEKKDYEKARQYYQSILDNEPENPNVLQNMGYTYWNTGDMKNAKEHLKRALSAYEKANNPELKEGLEYLQTFLKENGI